MLNFFILHVFQSEHLKSSNNNFSLFLCFRAFKLIIEKKNVTNQEYYFWGCMDRALLSKSQGPHTEFPGTGSQVYVQHRRSSPLTDWRVPIIQIHIDH